jgi:hypothetical protein
MPVVRRFPEAGRNRVGESGPEIRQEEVSLLFQTEVLVGTTSGTTDERTAGFRSDTTASVLRATVSDSRSGSARANPRALPLVRKLASAGPPTGETSPRRERQSG